jgi:hypothetical protein
MKEEGMNGAVSAGAVSAQSLNISAANSKI